MNHLTANPVYGKAIRNKPSLSRHSLIGRLRRRCKCPGAIQPTTKSAQRRGRDVDQANCGGAATKLMTLHRQGLSLPHRVRARCGCPWSGSAQRSFSFIRALKRRRRFSIRCTKRWLRPERRHCARSKSQPEGKVLIGNT